MTWSKAKRKARAGKRRCRRCHALWYRERGDVSQNCIRCRTHCRRCDVKLTPETEHKSTINKSVYICKKCQCEIAYNTDDTDQMWRRRDTYLTRAYGITATEYDKLLESQNGGCYICGRTPKADQRKLAVDHLHSKGEKKRNPRERRGRVRGLLCGQCNRALGKFKDNIEHLRKAADYLELWPAQKILKKEELSGKS